MFKDYNKYLSASLKVYLFVLAIIFILKLVGLDYFGFDVENKNLILLEKYILSYKFDYIWYFITIYINTYILITISINKYDKKYLLYSLPVAIINYINGYTIKNYVNVILFSFMLDFLVLLVSIYVLDKQNIKKNLKRLILITIGTIIYQFISSLTRISSIVINYNSFILNTLFNLDYFIMMIITYICIKGGVNSCGVVEVYSYLQKKLNLKNLLLKLQKITLLGNT